MGRLVPCAVAATTPAVTYVLDDHDQEGQLDSEGLLCLDRASDEVGRDIGAHDLQHRGLNISIGQSLDVTVADFLFPNLQRLGAVDRQRQEGLGHQEFSSASMNLLTQWSRGWRGSRSGRWT